MVLSYFVLRTINNRDLLMSLLLRIYIRLRGNFRISTEVMRDPSGVSRCSELVAFTTSEEASRALSEMNGKIVIS
ncbi:polyadenylate-binding 2-like isoform X1 [Olea europaea subsp. europaea]|uniref:Polyadenylate-binding 2-like isoform X1 n=1 Tax=Olea europaea subsp. europaea TaxID=158383 RepID=A0A8S0QWX4_OLEEU|nr:polyadenylate-binding 2-like isoform X1 [Olea europaea subsp. europaea]